MKITLLCSDERHPVNAYLRSWVNHLGGQHEVIIVRSKTQLKTGDLLFLISCSEVIGESERNLYRKTLIVHASDLPLGKGWSPHIWQIIEGVSEITLTLLEAANKVDSGDIWKKIKIKIPKDALCDEINHLIFETEISLIQFAIENIDAFEPQKQSLDIQSTYYPKREPEDSRIDPSKSIEDQFDLMRVCDPVRYPAYFELHGHRYFLRLEKYKCQKQ